MLAAQARVVGLAAGARSVPAAGVVCSRLHTVGEATLLLREVHHSSVNVHRTFNESFSFVICHTVIVIVIVICHCQEEEEEEVRGLLLATRARRDF